MKTIFYEKYRAPVVLELKQGEKPDSIVNEVLIKNHAATAAGLNGRKGEPFFIRFFMGLTKPKKNILEQELSGEDATHRPMYRHQTAALEWGGIAVLTATATFWAFEHHYPAFAVASAAIIISLLALWRAPKALSLWLIGALIVHVVFGMALGGYNLRYFDDTLHFAMVGSLTLLAIDPLLYRVCLNGAVLQPRHVLISAVFFSLGVGAAWELFEYSIDLTGAYRSQLGLPDTMKDILAGTAGGLSSSLWLIRAKAGYENSGIKD